MTDLVVGLVFRESLISDRQINTLNVGNTVRETLFQSPSVPTDLKIAQSVREVLLRHPAIPTDLKVGLIAREVLLRAPIPVLKLVTLYPTQTPSSVYGLTSNVAAQFDPSFSQLSISLWCCDSVTISGPHGVNSPSFQLVLHPDHATAFFEDAAGNTLFTGTFTNPNQATKKYHIMFSIDTLAQHYTFYGNGVAWTASASFPNTGLIDNVGA